MVLDVHSKWTWCLTSSETTGLVRDYWKKVWKGGIVWGGGGGIIYLSLHCHHQNDSCIKMGNDERPLKVSLTVRDKVTRLSTHHNFWREAYTTLHYTTLHYTTHTHHLSHTVTRVYCESCPGSSFCNGVCVCVCVCVCVHALLTGKKRRRKKEEKKEKKTCRVSKPDLGHFFFFFFK